MNTVWIAAGALAGASVIGSLLGFLLKNMPRSWHDTAMGYCAGLMLAAATLGLIVPAFETGGDSWWQALLVVASVVLGAYFLNILDLLTPHLHHITGVEVESHEHNKSLNSVLLFVMAIALHKLPEGMASGISLLEGAGQVSWLVSFGIAVQNVPEGMVIVSPLLLAGVKPLRTLLIALVISVLGVLGVWIGYAAGYLFEGVLPLLLAFAGGAMLYVTSDEVIPETHANGYQKQATYALLLGYVTLVIMERAF